MIRASEMHNRDLMRLLRQAGCWNCERPRILPMSAIGITVHSIALRQRQIECTVTVIYEFCPRF
jgi:hypothetical protein